MLRYWHFVDALRTGAERAFAPSPKIRACRDSKLEIEGWQSQVRPTRFGVRRAGRVPRGTSNRAGGADSSGREPRVNVAHRAIVWPDRSHGVALNTGLQSYDFGRDVTFTERPCRGSIVAPRGSSIWREGEIARSGSPLRLPLLLAIEAAHSARPADTCGSRPDARLRYLPENPTLCAPSRRANHGDTIPARDDGDLCWRIWRKIIVMPWGPASVRHSVAAEVSVYI